MWYIIISLSESADIHWHIVCLKKTRTQCLTLQKIYKLNTLAKFASMDKMAKVCKYFETVAMFVSIWKQSLYIYGNNGKVCEYNYRNNGKVANIWK